MVSINNGVTIRIIALNGNDAKEIISIMTPAMDTEPKHAPMNK